MNELDARCLLALERLRLRGRAGRFVRMHTGAARLALAGRWAPAFTICTSLRLYEVTLERGARVRDAALLTDCAAALRRLAA